MKRLIGIALVALSLGAAGCVVAVPPPPRVEVIGVAPYRNAVWVNGHWARRYGQWVWVGGHWR